MTLSQYLEELTASETSYSGFNLVLFSPSKKNETSGLQYEFTYLSNGGAFGPIQLSRLPSDNSCFGVSNDTPTGNDPFTGEHKTAEWTKVTQGRQILHDILRKCPDETALIEELFVLLR